MIDWFNMHGLDSSYTYKIAWFLPTKKSSNIIDSRANMPNDKAVRGANTCTIEDLLDVNLRPDFILRPLAGQMDPRLTLYIGALYDDMSWRQSKMKNEHNVNSK